MTDEVESAPSRSSRDARLEAALAEYYTSVDEGRKPERDVFLSRYPDLRDELEKIFASEVFVERLEGRFREAGGAGPVLPLAAGGRLGDYEILGEIAHGGMGVVYRARQRSLGRTVALKVVLTGEFASDEERRRFRREAETAAALDHPNIVPVYEVGERGGLCYLAMKLIEGKSLGELDAPVEDRYRFGARVVERIARAIHYAHRTGIIHRDLKPANILMDESGEPHIVDFGLARLQNHSGTITRTGMVLGTLRYMAPEQADGERIDADATVDVYGLGAILYQLLVGVPPFSTSSSVVLLKQVLQDDPPHPAFHDPAVPRDLVTICLKCLHKSPRKRYQTADDVAEDLRRFLDRRPIQARPAGLFERSMKWGRRRPATLAAVALLLVLAVVTVALRFDHRRREFQKQVALHETYALGLSRAFEGVSEREYSPAREFLDEYGSMEGEEDLRGFGWYLVWRLAHLDLSTQRLPPSQTHWVRFTPDDRRVAVSCSDGILIRNVADLAGTAPVEPLMIPKLSKGHTAVFDFSASGKFVVFADVYHRRAIVEELETGNRVANLSSRFVAWSPALHAVVTFEGNGKLSVVKIPSKQVLRSFETPQPLPGGCAVSSDGKEVAVVSAGGALSVWDLTTEGREPTDSLALGEVHDDYGGWLSFSPDASLIACAHPDSRVTLWERAGSKPRWTLSGHIGSVRCVAFSPDGNRLATGGDDRSIRIWDVKTGDELSVLRGHEGRVASLSFDHSGNLLASTSTVDSSLKLWDVSRIHTSYSLPATRLAENGRVIRTLVCTPDGDTVIVGEIYETMQVLDLDTSRGVAARLLAKIGGGPFGSYYHGASSPDGLQVLGIRPGHEVSTHNLVRKGESVTLDEMVSPGRHLGKVAALGFSPDGNLLGTNDEDGRLILWRRDVDGTRFHREEEISGPRGGIDFLFSANNRYLAVSCWNTADVFLCDLARENETIRFPGSELPMSIGALLFSPDSRRLATGGLDGVVKIWDIDGFSPGEPPTELMRCSGHVGAVFSLAFTPDGRRLASGSADTTIKIWDMTLTPPDREAFECLTLRGHEGQVTALAFTPDGRTLLSGGDLRNGGAEVRAWRGATEEEVRSYKR